MSKKKDTEEVVRALREQGWRVERTAKGHYMAYPPDKTKGQVTFGGTPSDRRALNNALSLLKKRGFRWPA